jgi:hypothetical protein
MSKEGSRMQTNDRAFEERKAFQQRVRARQQRTGERYQLAFRRQQQEEAKMDVAIAGSRDAPTPTPNTTTIRPGGIKETTMDRGELKGTSCIYCKALLSSATRKAHVWPASMGGRLRSRSICCDECNNAFSPHEDNLRESLSHAFASVGATNTKHEAIKVVLKFEGRDFVLADGNADMQVAGSRFDRDTKTLEMPLPAGLKTQAEQLAKLLSSHGFGSEDVDDILQLAPGDLAPVLPTGPTRREYDLSVGGRIEHKRVFIKMALELLAYHRHDLAVRGELSEARRFARHGTGTFRGKPDTRSEGSGLLGVEPRADVFNAVEVWSMGKSVFFRVVFLGPLVFTGTLTTEWQGNPFRAAYAFDARNPTNEIAQTYTEGDGPNLAIWFDGVKDESVANAVAALEAISLKLAESKPPLAQEPPPDLNVLREAVKAQLAKLQKRRGHRRT